jgi:hypothetical protein
MLTNPYDFSAGGGGSAFVPITAPLQQPNGFMFDMSTPLIPTPTSLSTASSATFTTTATATTPGLQQTEGWYQGFADPPPRAQNTLDLGSSEYPTRPWSHYLEGTMTANSRERTLLYHFVDNVLRLVFPILDLHKQGPSRVREILRSLDSNKGYYHCCLSISALHLKTVKKHRGRGLDTEIMRHRYAATWEIAKAYYKDDGHDMVLDATLAMIFFRCFVDSTEADGLMDVSWDEHFMAATSRINQLGLLEANPYTIPTFSVSLSAWVDILGATMLGQRPQFAHTYRAKYVNGISSGLRELMGCEDRIMYVISEIACLENMKQEGAIDDYTICHHASLLQAQLEEDENLASNIALANPMSTNGMIQADQLTRNMTAIFRVASRIYLASLLPGFHHDQQSTTDLVQRVAELLQYIPSGPLGYDRSLTWPMLIAGAFSTQTSDFRIILEQRIQGIGVSSDFGSFARMYTVLQEVWKLSDEPSSPYLNEADLLPPSSTSAYGFDPMSVPSQHIQTIGRPIKKQLIHWRDFMKARDWNYLLI